MEKQKTTYRPARCPMMVDAWRDGVRLGTVYRSHAGTWVALLEGDQAIYHGLTEEEARRMVERVRTGQMELFG